MGEAKNRQKAAAKFSKKNSTKILGWEVSKSYKKKLISWTIEGLLITVVSLGVLWVMFLFYPDV